MIYILAISYNCNYVVTEKDLSKQELLLFLIEKLEIHCIKKQAWILSAEIGQCPGKNWVMSHESYFATDTVVKVKKFFKR